jgi:nitrogenase subunit NifH
MSQYRKIDIKNLEQNFYFAFVENLHRQMINEIIRAEVIQPSEIPIISNMIKSNYSAAIMDEIKKFKTISQSKKETGD